MYGKTPIYANLIIFFGKSGKGYPVTCYHTPMLMKPNNFHYNSFCDELLYLVKFNTHLFYLNFKIWFLFWSDQTYRMHMAPPRPQQQVGPFCSLGEPDHIHWGRGAYDGLKFSSRWGRPSLTKIFGPRPNSYIYIKIFNFFTIWAKIVIFHMTSKCSDWARIFGKMCFRG